MTVLIDRRSGSGAVVGRDRDNARAKSVRPRIDKALTTNRVTIETWLLLNSRYHRFGDRRFWKRLRAWSGAGGDGQGIDLQTLRRIGDGFRDRGFSAVDRPVLPLCSGSE